MSGPSRRQRNLAAAALVLSGAVLLLAAFVLEHPAILVAVTAGTLIATVLATAALFIAFKRKRNER